MIQIINGKSKSLSLLAAEYYNQINPKKVNGKYALSSLISRLDEAINNCTGRKKCFYNELACNNYQLLKLIITAEPYQLSDVIEEIDFIRSSLELPEFFIENASGPSATSFGTEISLIFDFEKFRSSKKCDWFLDELCIPICPYCNCNSTISVNSGSSKKHLLDIDHFYSKVRHPFLALSFNNLIPSCNTCNTRYKGAKPFSLSSHTHPYVDCFHDFFEISFSLNSAKINNLLSQDINVIFKARNGVDIANINRGSKLIFDLGLLEVYQSENSKNELLRVDRIASQYPPSQILELGSRQINGHNIFQDQVKTYCEEYNLIINKEDIRITLLGKLKLDIVLSYIND
jgi:hypothetical protein